MRECLYEKSLFLAFHDSIHIYFLSRHRERAIKKKADEAAITEESSPSAAQHGEEPSSSTLCSDKPSSANKK